MYEVEQKYPVADFAAVNAALAELGAQGHAAIEQEDTYYAHPARDFAATDEALRIRRVGEQNCITYKGPKLDVTTKTRREIELPLSAGAEAASAFGGLLEALSFRPVFQVRKRRQPLTIPWQGCEVIGALDEVAGLGTFVELELAADDATLAAAQAAIHSLAARLGLQETERRSYLELLLERREAKTS